MDHFNLEIPLEHDITGLIDQIIADLNNLDLPKDAKKKADNAIKDLEKARDRIIQSTEDVDKNIHDIIKAIEDLRAADSAELTDIILKTDTLLRCEQGWYYFY